MTITITREIGNGATWTWGMYISVWAAIISGERGDIISVGGHPIACVA